MEVPVDIKSICDALDDIAIHPEKASSSFGYYILRTASTRLADLKKDIEETAQSLDAIVLQANEDISVLSQQAD